MINSFQSDVAISGDIAVGGNAALRGSLKVDRNLVINGWLDAKNLRTPQKGLFATAQELADAYPFPHPGWWALVGNQLPAAIYVVQDGKWTNSGHTGGSITVEASTVVADVSAISEAVEQLQATVASLQAYANGNAADIAANASSIAQLQQSVGAMAADCSTLLLQMQAATTSISALQGRVSALEAQL